MVDRREFIQYSGAAAVAAAIPVMAIAERFQHLPRRRIPGTEESLPIVGLGNSSAFQPGGEEAAAQIMQIFANYGGGYVDCGGASRFVVADVARSLGIAEDTFLGAYFSGENESTSRLDAKRVLKATGKPILDLMHSVPEDAVPHWKTFQTWKEEGLTKYIGLARHRKEAYPQMMQAMKTGSVDFLQVNYSMLETEAEQEILPMAADKGVAVTINRPFINGRYFEIVRGNELPEWAVEFQCETWAQFSLKFILSHPAVNCVLTETSNPEHARDNIGAGFGPMPDVKTRQKMLQVIQGMV